MKYWIIRIPDRIPFGETSRRAIFLAMSLADPVKVRGGGCVESVVTFRTHFLFAARFFATVGHTPALGMLEVESMSIGGSGESSDGLT
jgi:hypothetical protein